MSIVREIKEASIVTRSTASRYEKVQGKRAFSSTFFTRASLLSLQSSWLHPHRVHTLARAIQ